MSKPAPRSYVIRTAKGYIRRNRAQVRPAVPPPREEKRSDFASFEGFPETEGQSRLHSSDKWRVMPEVSRESQLVPEGGTSSCVGLSSSAAKPGSLGVGLSSSAAEPGSSGVGLSSFAAEPGSSNRQLAGDILYKTRYGRVVKPPVKFDPSA